MTVIYCLDRICQVINLIVANYVLCHHIKSQLKWMRNENYLPLCIKISASESLNLVQLKFNKIHPSFEFRGALLVCLRVLNMAFSTIVFTGSVTWTMQSESFFYEEILFLCLRGGNMVFSTSFYGKCNLDHPITIFFFNEEILFVCLRGGNMVFTGSVTRTIRSQSFF